MSRKSKGKSSNINIVSTSSTGWPKWKQSPIHLNPVCIWPKKFPPLLLSGHWLDEGSAVMKNTGETVQIDLLDRDVPFITGGPLRDEYQLLHLQFRWGENNCHGAEHTVDYTWYSMEAQALHWNTRYGSSEKCHDKSDGMAIISYLFLVSGCPGIADNPEFTQITDYLSQIKGIDRSVNIPPDCLKWMTNCFSTPGYYTYQGSLTTPPYYECVTWIIIPNPIRISVNQKTDGRAGVSDWFKVSKSFFHSRCTARLLVQHLTTCLPKLGQSPIDIVDKAVRPYKFPPLFLTGHWLRDGEATLINTGKTAKIVLSGDRIPSYIKGGPLVGDEYEFKDVHFHWREENCYGSEHTINGTWFSMEAHAFHWNRKYGTLEESMKHKDGICVLAYLFLVTDKTSLCCNPHLEKITENLQYVREANTEVKVPPNCLLWMKNCMEVNSYYTYQGSLTIPPYAECAIWIVIPKIIPISSVQMNEFRQLQDKDGDRILSNARKVQSLRGRRVFLAVNSC